ncbi:GNAT family N-acetyltransferase [Candidatus Woesearchaeota archaeon]|nr:GNAT family N-acetyltransferase [Candidatus Woesearchaeota archaeon]
MVDIKDYSVAEHLGSVLELIAQVYPDYIDHSSLDSREQAIEDLGCEYGSVALVGRDVVGVAFYDSLSFNLVRWHHLARIFHEASQVLRWSESVTGSKAILTSDYIPEGSVHFVEAYASDLLQVGLKGGEGYVWNLAVREDFRRRGIAERLIQKQLHRAKNLGAGYVFTDSWLQGGSDRLFTRVGFESLYKTGTDDRTFLYMGKRVD